MLWNSDYKSGVRTASSSQGGSKKIKIKAYIGRILLFGGTKRGTLLFWRYAEGYDFDLGVFKYQNLRTPAMEYTFWFG
jgi:hypothetical protein